MNEFFESFQSHSNGFSQISSKINIYLHNNVNYAIDPVLFRILLNILAIICVVSFM